MNNNAITNNTNIYLNAPSTSDIIVLQDKLKKLGYYDLSITGSFDNYTKDKLLKFQNDYQITQNNILNNLTWDALYGLTNNATTFDLYEQRPTLRLGDQGPYVTELQTLLTNLLYYNGEIDGIFGSGTQRAVKVFQSNNRLAADGIVGRDTWSALLTLYSPMAICEENSGNIITHTVVKGDTLWDLARRYGTTVEAIKRLNNLTSDLLKIGQELLIPTQNEPAPPPNNYINYTVIAGDNLWTLARRFNTTVNDIKSLNNLTSDRLSIGQILKIPTSQNTITYTVVAGDSLWIIARRFNTTVEAIRITNNLTSDRLQIGQKLIIQI